MKEMKRILSLFLCAVMLIGYIPVGALATEGETATEPVATETVVETTEAVVETTETVVETTETVIETTETVVETTETVVETTEAAVPETTEETVPETTPVRKPVLMGMGVSKKEAAGETVISNNADVDRLFIATDRHANTTVIGSIINNMVTVNQDLLDYVGLGGDMVGSGNTHPAYNSSTVLSEVTGAATNLTAAEVDIVAGIHDTNVTDDANIVLPYQGGGAQIFKGDKFYVYGVEEYCISEDSNESNWSAQAQAFVDWANGDEIDKAKAIIVLSHYPLHAKRDDNGGAYYWHQALNTVATGSATGTEVIRDIVFFHGHNHTEDSNEYVYNVGDPMSIQNGSSTASETIYYTYATAGYLNQNSKATLVTITDNTIELTKYGTSGSGTAMTSVPRIVEVPAEDETTDPVETTVTCAGTYLDGDTYAENADTVTATGIGLTGISAVVNETVDLSAFDTDRTIAYNVALEGDIEGDVKLVFDLAYRTSEDLVVYSVGADDVLTAVEFTTKDVTEEDDFYSVSVTLTASSAAGTYIIGVPGVEEGAKLTGISVTNQPEINKYTIVDDMTDDGKMYLDLTGLVVTASYDNGETAVVEWDQFGDVEGGYTLGAFDLYTPGEKTITITYGDYTANFVVTVYESSFEDAGEAVADAVADVLASDYVARDIEVSGYTQGDVIKVIMPAPEGANVVYHVSDENELTKIETAVFGDGIVTFTTNHFSTYVVGNSTEITVPDPEDVTISGTTTTVPKDFYVLVSTPSENKQYIIVNRNTAGSGYALKEKTTTGLSITVNAAGNGISAPYIETTDKTIMWNAASGMTFQSEKDNYYLHYSSGLTFSKSSSTDWTVGTNSAYTYTSSRYRYLYNDDGTWTTSSSRNASSNYNAYFYELQSVSVTTSADGDYSIAGTDVTQLTVPNSTVDLTSTLTRVYDGNTTTTDVSATATYTVVEGGDPNGIISGDIDGNTVTLTGKEGAALVKVSYTIPGTDKTVTNYIKITATEPNYTVEITDATGTAMGSSYIQSGVAVGTTLDLDAKVSYKTSDTASVTITEPVLSWEIEEGSVATIDAATGLLTFNGAQGDVVVRVTYTTVNGTEETDKITITATKSTASTDEKDYPYWGEPGSVRYDKTATAVGDFSKTGVAQIELSMAGIPFGGAVDIVLMLDMTGSMTDSGIQATLLAAQAFVDKVGKTSSGFTDSHIGVYIFNANGVNGTYCHELGKLDAASYATLSNWLNPYNTELYPVNNGNYDYKAIQASGGTPYDTALAYCHDKLAAHKSEKRSQYCVFMSDGGPTTYEGTDGYTYYGGNASGDRAITSYIGGYTSSTSSDWTYNMPDEYYSTDMKADGVTIYSIGLLLQNKPNSPSPWSNMTASTVDSTTGAITSMGSHYYFTSKILTGIASDASKFYHIHSVDSASTATSIFTAIAEDINAASNVVVEDVIADDYNITFDWPTAVMDNDKVTIGDVDNDGTDDGFYLEVVKYGLGTDNERDGSYEILQRVYVTNTAGNLTVSKIATGKSTDASLAVTTTITPTFSAKDKDTDKAYYVAAEDGAITDQNGSKWNYVADGSGTHHMSTGAAVVGNVLYTPYFVYNPTSKMFTWTVTALTEKNEMALRYFVYLTNSMESVYTNLYPDLAEQDKVEAGPYYTNAYAKMSYTNHLGNECERFFPMPQLTWNGAQVSYVFYLVNENGQPVNRAGELAGSFNEAVYVTDIFTTSVVWNDTAGIAELDISYYADKLLPQGYELYDDNASYTVYVHRKAGESNEDDVYNYFVIEGSQQTALNTAHGVTNADVTTTKVFNTKSGTKYTIAKYGEEDDAAYPTNTKGDTTVLYSAYSTDESVEITYKDKEDNVEYTYDKVEQLSTADFDYGATTVAFAVTWKVQLNPDTVVVDYGLPVDINVVKNDFIYNLVTGISETKPGYEGQSSAGYTPIDTTVIENANYTAEMRGDNIVRFTPETMLFDEPETFYYETQVEYYVDGEKTNPYLYSTVTVIPATTIYYEDSFLDLKTYNNKQFVEVDVNAETWSPTTAYYTLDAVTNTYKLTTKYTEGTTYYQPQYTEVKGWETDGTAQSATQAQDRPGESQISDTLDADNVYGYDAAYSSMSTYSMGSAAKISVSDTQYGTATFTFYGTGFDVIGLTSNTTGALFIDVYEGSTTTGTKVKSLVVDTYYGYTRNENGEWVTSVNDPNALYQVPVMKVSGLDYGQYTVKLSALYASLFDHDTTTANYDLYLDAVRIYDPTGNEDEVANKAYVADGEGWPIYQELRNNVIAASDLEEGTVNGIVFIDSDDQTWSLADYISYGPNNELYLAPGQAIVFELNLDDCVNADSENIVDKVHLGMKLGNGTEASYAIVDSAAVPEDDDSTENVNEGAAYIVAAAKNKLTTTTDMYYDITELKDKAIVIYNNGNGTINEETEKLEGGILSLTNIKVTFKEKPTEVSELFYVNADTILNLLNKMQTVTPEQDETPAAIELAATLPKVVKSGESIEVIVTATRDGQSVTNLTDIIVYDKADESTKYPATYNQAPVNAYKANVKLAAEKTEVRTLVIEAAGATPLEAQITVYVYAPTLTLTTNPDPAIAGTPTTLVVTTSDEVDAMSIAGTMVTTYTTSGDNRIWTAKETFADEGTVDITLIAYSEEGYEYEEDETITVGPSTRTVAQAVRNLVTSIAKTLISWFRK